MSFDPGSNLISITKLLQIEFFTGPIFICTFPTTELSSDPVIHSFLKVQAREITFSLFLGCHVLVELELTPLRLYSYLPCCCPLVTLQLGSTILILVNLLSCSCSFGVAHSGTVLIVLLSQLGFDFPYSYMYTMN